MDRRRALVIPHKHVPEHNMMMQGWSCTACGDFLCGEEAICLLMDDLLPRPNFAKLVLA